MTTLLRSRKYRLTPEVVPALQKAIFVNINTDERTPALVHTLEIDDDGNFVVEILGIGKEHALACDLAEKAEAGRAVIFPARNPDSEHVFEPGESVTFDAELYHVGVFTSTQYGRKFIHRFSDRKGNELTWTTNTMASLGTYRVTAKIKAHEEYFNIKQTAVTHCRFEAIPKRGTK